mmetsp:Transcript_31725/g.61923  ORF Transcript_31725/g.61923 Transcript_31725/m.61923 type:complete len:291 (-) Transcript_31725:523-1395(-)|eukprot:CAMPEP_0173384454 /NCGR_PEP_ID=MMETSP1356-20130122/7028_1 /TAXON_ID=77927 ORGANISM="Hemiselmis virescens, Strain PCC157" /NCGR_SAMPLE_ID=MMETSP1356 /ASSEMBLY_ACC=CAM_ASM_000847 /LENGTH=290 /DNA_ID=CAMNT_0014339815 /DNA_START=183 /DNA_END=1055 /DNA_ORIENTATION=+
MGTGAAAPQTLRRGAHAFAITLLVILAWIPVGSDALSAKAAPKLAFAPPNQRLAQHVSRGLIRMASAAAAGVMCEVAGQATSPKPQLPTMQASLASDGAIATAVAPAQMLPVLSSMASAAAYRGTMALSYDSLLASMRSSPAAKVNLPTVMMAAAATGLASAIYISATRYRDGPQMRNTVCASPQTLGGGRTRFQDVAATFSHEAVEYAAFFGLQHMVLASLPYLAGTWYGCAVAGAGTGLTSTVLGEAVRNRVSGGGVSVGRSVRKSEVAAQSFVFVGVMSSIRMALKC